MENYNYLKSVPRYMIVGILWIIAGILIIVPRMKITSIIALSSVLISFILLVPTIIKKPAKLDERTKNIMNQAKAEALDSLLMIIAVVMTVYLITTQDGFTVDYEISIVVFMVAAFLILIGLGLLLIGIRIYKIEKTFSKDINMDEED